MDLCPNLEQRRCTSDGYPGHSHLDCQTQRVSAPEVTAGLAERPSEVLRKPKPGPMFGLVKIASYVELVLFAILLIVWLAPGFEDATFYAGLAHGIGFIALAILIWIAVLRHQAPYTLLAATLTPVGPVGSVIAIHWIERKSENPIRRS